MINLAGDNKCDEIIKQELKEAGIEEVYIGKMNREVPATIIGKCNNFIFKRAWYYWVVEGYMPLKYAQELYDNYKGLNIRVAGHCGNPPPEEWSSSKEYLYMDKSELFDKYINKEIITMDEYNKICIDIKNKGEQFVTNYHIDTQEGLNKFVEVVKKYNIIG